jgi:hypothetical protein
MAAKLAAFADEVGLIRVPACRRGVGSFGLEFGAFQNADRMLEARNPGEALRRKAYERFESTFEMPPGDTHPNRQLLN